MGWRGNPTQNISYGCSHARAETLVLLFFLFWVCRVGEALPSEVFKKLRGVSPLDSLDCIEENQRGYIGDSEKQVLKMKFAIENIENN